VRILGSIARVWRGCVWPCVQQAARLPARVVPLLLTHTLTWLGRPARPRFAHLSLVQPGLLLYLAASVQAVLQPLALAAFSAGQQGLAWQCWGLCAQAMQAAGQLGACTTSAPFLQVMVGGGGRAARMGSAVGVWQQAGWEGAAVQSTHAQVSHALSAAAAAAPITRIATNEREAP